MKRKRPGQAIALLVLMAFYSLLTLGMSLFYFTNHIVYDSATGLSVQAFPRFQALLLAGGVLYAAVFVLLLLGTKAGFWAAVVIYVGDGVLRLLSLDLFSLLLTALYLWLLFARPTRAYFRIGRAGSEEEGP